MKYNKVNYQWIYLTPKLGVNLSRLKKYKKKKKAVIEDTNGVAWAHIEVIGPPNQVGIFPLWSQTIYAHEASQIYELS